MSRPGRILALLPVAALLWLPSPVAVAVPGGSPPGQAAPLSPGGETGSTSPSPSELSPELREQLAAMEDIRDIRPPVTVGLDPHWGLIAAAAALLLAMVALLAWWRRRRRPLPPRSEAVSVSPEEAALAALAALDRTQQDWGDKTYYFRLCEVVRRYLDARFGLDTLEQTTEELAPELRRLPVADRLRTDLVDLFRRADPVRYADAAVPSAQRQGDRALAEAVVRAGTRDPEAAGV